MWQMISCGYAEALFMDNKDITWDESVPENNREQAKNRLFSLKNPKNSTKD